MHAVLLTQRAEEVTSDPKECLILLLDGELSLEGQRVCKHRGTEAQDETHVVLVTSGETGEEELHTYTGEPLQTEPFVDFRTPYNCCACIFTTSETRMHQ